MLPVILAIPTGMTVFGIMKIAVQDYLTSGKKPYNVTIVIIVIHLYTFPELHFNFHFVPVIFALK